MQDRAPISSGPATAAAGIQWERLPMQFNWRHAAIVRMLLYPIQFDCHPMLGIERVLARDVFACHSKLWPIDVISAIDAGLSSSEKLSELIPMHHSEELIRSYLATLRNRLEGSRPHRHIHCEAP
jgi:hypothetical protein